MSCLLAILLLLPAAVSAHPLAPVLLELSETADGEVDVRWKTSVWKPVGSEVEPVLPVGCEPVTQRRAVADDVSVTSTWRVKCDPPELVGREVRIEGLGTSGINGIVRVVFSDGRVVQGLLHGDRPSLRIDAAPSKLAVARAYGRLGVTHILSGLDHLVFVFGLLLLASSKRALAAIVTSFTAGHSLTLALSVLGYATLPQRPIELLIALTVFYLAVEIATARANTPVRRRPGAMAFAFGLLHGLGFAGALREAGLPQQEIPLALLSFNIGIELGQLVFVVAVVAVVWIFSKARLRFVLPAVLRRAPVYAMGTLAAYWCFERVAALWR